MRQKRWGLAAVVAFGWFWPVHGQDQDKVKVSFEDIELEALAQQVERVTKKTFLFQEQLLKGKKVTIRSEKAISPDEFYRVFQSLCLMHGLALVPAPDENIALVKIVPAPQAAKEPGAQPVLGRGEPVPLGEGLIYYLMAPKHIAGAKALSVITPALSPIGGIVLIPNSDLVLVIDAASAVQRAQKILALVDAPGDPVAVTAVALEHLHAAQAKGQVTEFSLALEKATTGETGRPRLEVLVDERLNLIHLIGREAEVKRAQAYLKELDRQLPAVQRTIGYYRLKNVPVGEIVESVRQFLGLAVSIREADRRRAASNSSPLSGRPTRELSGGPALPPSVIPPEPPRPERQEGRPSPDGKPLPQGTSTPAASTSTDTEVIAIEGLNTLAVIGNQAVHDEVKRILENLDKRKGQVLIEVAILQVTGDDSLDTGVEVLLEDTRGNGARINGGTGFGLGTQGDTKGAGFPNIQNLASFTGGALRYLKQDDISVLIRMISTKAHVNILSQPLLLVNDNEAANFTTKVSEPTVVTSQGTATTQTSFAGFADATTSLSITPQISPDGYLNLRITQSFEEFTGQAGGAGIPPPKVSNNVTTMITVPDRHTAILGGFTRDSATDSRTGIPILMDVPILQWFTSHRSTRLTKSRLYLFVRPRILSSEGFADLRDLSREKAGKVQSMMRDPRMRNEVDNALEPRDTGIREAPLPFDHRK